MEGAECMEAWKAQRVWHILGSCDWLWWGLNQSECLYIGQEDVEDMGGCRGHGGYDIYWVTVIDCDRDSTNQNAYLYVKKTQRMRKVQRVQKVQRAQRVWRVWPILGYGDCLTQPIRMPIYRSKRCRGHRGCGGHRGYDLYWVTVIGCGWDSTNNNAYM